MRAPFLFLASLALLPSCVGGTLGDTSQFEMFPLRAATASEGKDLKRCLKAAQAAQETHRQKTGKYVGKVTSLPLDGACNGLRVGQKRTQTGYEISAGIHEDEQAVLWSVNEKGVIEEHLDPADSDEDLW